MIANLCEADSERRSSCTELYNWLRPYQEAIISLEAFEVKNLPPKISQSIQGTRPVQNQGISYDPRQSQQVVNGSHIYPQQNFPPSVQGQRVTYTQVVQPPPQYQPQPQQKVIINPSQQQFPNATFAPYTSSQYQPGPNYPIGQTVTYSQPTYNPSVIRQQDGSGDRPKTGMELTLEKIDEQLQMSRRMFPS